MSLEREIGRGGERESSPVWSFSCIILEDIV